MEILKALLPSLGVGILFVVVFRAIIGADRNERKAMARLDEASTRDDSAQ